MGNMQLLQLKSDKLDIREMRLIDNAVAALKNQLGILDNISDSVKIAVGTRAFQSEALTRYVVVFESVEDAGLEAALAVMVPQISMKTAHHGKLAHCLCKVKTVYPHRRHCL